MSDDVPTVREWLREWLDRQHTRLQPTTIKSYRSNVELYLVPTIGDVRLDEIEMRKLEDLYVHLLERGGKFGKPLALTTVKRTHRTLHKALEDARRWRIIETNPVSGAQLPRIDPQTGRRGSPSVRVWTAEQLRTFLRCVDEDRLRWLWHVAAGTGMRRAELLGLPWFNVDSGFRWLRVTQTLSRIDGEMRIRPTKSYRPRTIHLDRHTAKVLRKLREEQDDRRALVGPDWANENDLVFTTGMGTPLTPDRITTHFTTLSTAAPVPRLRLHDLRHTHASLLLQAGVPAHVVADRMGHHNVRVTLRIYAHLLPGMDEEAAEIFGEHVWGDEGADFADEATEEGP